MANLINVKPAQVTEVYDFFDTATGTGFKRYYAFNCSSAAGVTEYKLIDQIVKSGVTSLCISYAVWTGNMQEKGYWDFDIAYDFQLDTPRIIVGDCFINLTQGQFNYNTLLQARTDAKVAVEFYRVRSGTPTLLCSGSSITWGYSDPGWDVGLQGTRPLCTSSRDLVIKTTFPETRIKKGDTLRARFIMYSKETVGYTFPLNIGMGCDPAGRDDSQFPRVINQISGSTVTSVDIPFKIIR